MSTTTAPLGVAELSELPHDSWVNDGFTAIVRKIERKTSTKTNKPFWKCVLADTTGSATVGATFFTAPKFSEGQQVDFLGQGIKFKNGQYGPEVSIGDKTEIHVVGRVVADQQPGRTAAPGNDGNAPLAAGTDFHKAMKRAALLYLHCLDYGRQIDAKNKTVTGTAMAPDQLQACVSSLFIFADRGGLGGMVPQLGGPVPSTPPPRASSAKPLPGPDGSVARNEVDEDVSF
jgi:hypothetical protein